MVNKTVEDYLNSTDYSVDAFYVPSDFALEFVTFIKMVDGGESENKTPVVHFKMLDNFVQDNGLDTINLCHRGIAKALALDELVYTPYGSKTIAEVQTGEYIYGEDGIPTQILAKSEIFNKPMYKITLADGRSIKVSEDHINTIIHRRQKRVDGRRVNYLDRRNVTTKELLDINLTSTRKATKKNPKGIENKVWIPLCSPVQYPEQDLPVDPYTLGLLIGDGSLDRKTGFARLHAHKTDYKTYLEHIPYEIGNINKSNDCYGISILGLGSKLKELGINVHGNNKFIPSMYEVGSVKQRLNLLQGLMDTDGTIYKNGGMAYSTTSEQLANDVKTLVQSLGGIATVVENTSESVLGKYYRVNIRINQQIFKLERKFKRQRFNHVDKVAIVNIEAIDTEPSQCLMVSNHTKTFLTTGYTVTHNSTLLEYLILYLAVYETLPKFGKVPYALYVSDSIDNGVKKMRKSLEYKWNNSEFLQKYIPTIKFTDIRWEFINKSGTSFVVSGYGAKTGVRGTRENGSRPVLALLDDLISDSDARSATVIADVEDTVYKAIDYALHPKKRKIIWNGTPFNAKDPLYKAVESGAWNVNVYPVCEKFPCDRSEFRGSWEDRFNYDYVKRQYDKAKLSGKIDTFNQELMLRIMSEEDRLILDADISWYKRGSVLNNMGAFNFYITTDFATSEKTSGDFSVISVWAYNSNGDWYWVDGICKKQTMDKNIDDLFRLAQIYKPLGVGIEVTGQQGGFIPWLQDQMLVRNCYFTLASENNNGKPGIRPNTNKMQRFQVVVPWFKANKMYFPEERKTSPEITEALDELTLASQGGFKSKHDDFIDTISMLSVMNAWKPSVQVNYSHNKDTDMWEMDEEREDDGGIGSYIV